MDASSPERRSQSFFARCATLASLIRFSHTLFALPWALAGLFLGSGGWPSWRTLVLVLLAMIGARTAAMTFNRLVDRRFDATNPRTKDRPSVTGAVSPLAMGALLAASSALFVAAAFLLGPLCGWLSIPVLAVLLGYSLAKRFTVLAHWILGFALGLSPASAWLAARGSLDAEILPSLALSFAVLFWTAGFDILYACQDVQHDRAEGLHAIPARLGIARALWVARASHALVPPCLALAGALGQFGLVYALGVFLVTALLLWQHRLVRPNDLSRVGVAFFQANVAISVIMMLSILVDQLTREGA